MHSTLQKQVPTHCHCLHRTSLLSAALCQPCKERYLPSGQEVHNSDSDKVVTPDASNTTDCSHEARDACKARLTVFVMLPLCFPARPQEFCDVLHKFEPTAQLSACEITRVAPEGPNVGATWHEAFCCHDTRPPAGHNGLAILVRPGMGITATNHRSSACGRAQLLDIQWGGQTFCLVNTYWPATGLSDRTLFLRDVLIPTLQGPTVALPQAWICGDFNFVADTGRDRSPREREREIVTEATQSGGVLKTRGSNDHSIRG